MRARSDKRGRGVESPVVGVIIPAFRPGADLLTAVTSAIAQAQSVVVVVDEHPVSSQTAAVVRACGDAGAMVVPHNDNRGIGAALNTGLAALGSHGPAVTHVLTLDQDSKIPPGYVAALLAQERAAVAQGVAVGMTAPGHVASIIRLRPRRRQGVLIGGEPIQSGLLVSTEVLERLDGFDEALFIDGVDTDFYLRAKDLRLRCVLAPEARLQHRLGQPITVAGDRELPLLVASSFRYFYQWRNLVSLIRRHGRRHPAWAVVAFVKAARHLMIVTVLAPGRMVRLREAVSGLGAGLRGRSGRRPTTAGEHAQTARARKAKAM